MLQTDHKTSAQIAQCYTSSTTPSTLCKYSVIIKDTNWSTIYTEKHSWTMSN